MHPMFLTTTEVAAFLGVSAKHLLERREEWAVERGFPDPMPVSRNPFRWRRDRILAWIEEQGLSRPAAAALPPRPGGTNVVLLEEARRA